MLKEQTKVYSGEEGFGWAGLVEGCCDDCYEEIVLEEALLNFKNKPPLSDAERTYCTNSYEGVREEKDVHGT